MDSKVVPVFDEYLCEAEALTETTGETTTLWSDQELKALVGCMAKHYSDDKMPPLAVTFLWNVSVSLHKSF